MKPSEGGYATASILGLLAILGLAASWSLTLSLSNARLGEAKFKRAALEREFNNRVMEEIFQMVSAPERYQLRFDFIEIDGVKVVVERSDEQARPNFRYASTEILKPSLSRLLPPGTDIDLLLQSRDRSLADAELKHLSDFNRLAEFPERVRTCLADRFTLFSATMNPLSSSRRSTLRGAIIRLSVKTLPRETPALRLRVVVLVTGNAETPFHILDWTQDHDATEPNCAQPL